MSHAEGDEKNWKAYHIMVQNWPFAGRPQSGLFFSQFIHFYRYGPLAWMACSRRGFTKDLFFTSACRWFQIFIALWLEVNWLESAIFLFHTDPINEKRHWVIIISRLRNCLLRMKIPSTYLITSCCPACSNGRHCRCAFWIWENLYFRNSKLCLGALCRWPVPKVI